MGTIKNRKEQLAEIRKDVLDDLMKIGDMTEVVDMLRECNRDPDKKSETTCSSGVTTGLATSDVSRLVSRIW